MGCSVDDSPQSRGRCAGAIRARSLAGYAAMPCSCSPGRALGGEHRGKPAIEAFLRRFVEAGIVGEAHDILVNGPPWRTTVCMLFLDHALDDRRQRRLREPGHRLRPHRVGEDRLPRGLRGHPESRGVRRLPGPTPVGRQLIVDGRQLARRPAPQAEHGGGHGDGAGAPVGRSGQARRRRPSTPRPGGGRRAGRRRRPAPPPVPAWTRDSGTRPLAGPVRLRGGVVGVVGLARSQSRCSPRRQGC